MTKKVLVFFLSRTARRAHSGGAAAPVFFLLFGVDGVDSSGEPLSGPAFSCQHRGVDTVLTGLGAVGGQSPFLGLP